MRVVRTFGASPALVEMLDRSGELDAILSGRGLVFDNPPTQPITYRPPLEIPPADWDAERREREARKREHAERECTQQRQEILDDIEREQGPYPRRRGWLR